MNLKKIFHRGSEHSAHSDLGSLHALGKDPKDKKTQMISKKEFRRQKEKEAKSQAKRQKLKIYIERAGYDFSIKKLFKIFFNTTVGIVFVLSAYLLYFSSANYGMTWGRIMLWMVVLWVFAFPVILFVVWTLFFIYVDLRIYKRTIDLEEVLPDFLQLAASNINAGMTIDKALWYAVRPRFGVLAKEIENIAKETMSGADLKIALERFSLRYDSILLKRTVNMINESIDAGGQIGDLLNRIANDIQQQKALMKEMAANVMTYVIFISFSTIVAAPFLFALSGVLISVVTNISTSLGDTTSAASSAGLPISFSGSGISISDFNIFAIVSLTVTSTFSAMMISTIKKGNVKSGIRYIPVFVAISLTIFFIAQRVADVLLGVFLSF